MIHNTEEIDNLFQLFATNGILTYEVQKLVTGYELHIHETERGIPLEDTEETFESSVIAWRILLNDEGDIYSAIHFSENYTERYTQVYEFTRSLWKQTLSPVFLEQLVQDTEAKFSALDKICEEGCAAYAKTTVSEEETLAV